METSVLLITFNHPEYTKIMLEALKAANVKNLYIFKMVHDYIMKTTR